MREMQRSVIITLVILSLLLAVMVAQKINLTTADLGRHIKNGEVMLHAGEIGLSRGDLLHTNFYSYTEPNFPFVNHHWGTGIIFYLIFSAFGWVGLSLFHILIFVGAFALLFLLASRKLPLLLLTPLSLLLLPLIADRTEIRPETISYLFIAVFIYLLVRFGEKSLDKKYLYLLPIITFLWANIHIYFVFGLFVIGAFLMELVIRKNWEKVRTLIKVLILSTVAACVTPFGPKALLYPFTIFQNYGYKLVENQSISFLENISFFSPTFLWWKMATVLTIFLTVLTIWKTVKSRAFDKTNFPLALGIIALTFGFLSYTSIRNFTIFGLVLIPYFAYLISAIRNSKEKAFRSSAEREPAASRARDDGVLFRTVSDEAQELITAGVVIVSLALLIIIPIRFSQNMPWSPSWGLGLLPNINASAEFVEANNIKGPTFSNYDIGGYLIFHKFPEEKIFVDNRPEAYSVPFFEETYVPMQEKLEVWSKELEKYDFNTIWFYRLDYTPWSQEFLIARVQDPTWAPVYVDNYVIIFLHRTPENQSLIEQYELPKSLFSVK